MSLSLNSYYKRIKIKNKEILNPKVPMILAMNHPNAFMDPVVFTLVAYPPKYKYLARGDAFKPGLATYLLERIGIVPIFRIQDGGREGLSKNNETYRRVNQLLAQKNKIMIFAEGLCIYERRLRPIKKGVPRMIFGAMDHIQNKNFVVIPVGVNYSNAPKMGSTLFYNVGEPIFVTDYYQDYKEHASKTYNKFIKDLEPKLKELTIHINNPENDQLIFDLESILLKQLCREKNLNANDPESKYEITKLITSVINEEEINNNSMIEELRLKTSEYVSKLKSLNIRDWLVDPFNASKITYLNVVIRGILILLVSPLIIRGMIGNYLPYKLSEWIVKKKVKQIEFYASFNLGIGTFLCLFYYIIQFVIAYLIAPNIGWPFLVIIVSYLTGKFTLNFYPFILKTKGIYNTLKIGSQLNKLRADRVQIESLFASINKN